MGRIADEIRGLRDELPQGVELVAVSKFHPAEAVAEAYNAGQRLFGENRPQEMTAKSAVLPADIRWHMIGHLQANKVKMVVPYVSMIESVDSAGLLRDIDRRAATVGRVIDVLLEIHVAVEATKSGFAPDECRRFFGDGEWTTLKNVRICGLMCMASHTGDEARIHADFHRVHSLFDELRQQYFPGDGAFRWRSWGMSEDYKIAIEEGANIVRIGTRIFGRRDYGRKQ